MSGEYQAVYDAARSRLFNCDVGSAVESAASSVLAGAPHALALIAEAYVSAANEQQRPSVLFKPKLETKGRRWFASYGDDLIGTGDTPAAAMTDFDKRWIENNWEAPQE